MTPRPATGAQRNFQPDDLLGDLRFEIVDTDTIKIAPGHARKVGARALETVKGSISSLGFVFPLVLDDQHRLIAGHLRLEAARALGMTRLPAVLASGLTEAQLRMLRLADNKIPTLSDFDQERLQAEFKVVLELNPEMDFTVVGFGVGEIDVVLDDAPSGADPDDVIPDIDEVPVTRAGDVWRVGDRHVIVCGDARSTGILSQVLGDAVATAVFIDPPFNFSISRNVSGLGAVHHAEFAMASGEMSPAEFVMFLTDSLNALAEACIEGAVLFVCMDWRHMRELLAAADAAGLTLLNLCVWNKTNAGMGSLYRSQHELVFVLKKGKAPHVNNVKLGSGGRYRTNVWTCPGANTFRVGRDQDLADHPTVKPTALVADAIKDVTRRNDLVIDTFLGSGTTLIAAERSGRRCAGVEIEPKFVDVAIRRFTALWPDAPITLAETGETFAQVRERRDHEGADTQDVAANSASEWDIL